MGVEGLGECLLRCFGGGRVLGCLGKVVALVGVVLVFF